MQIEIVPRESIGKLRLGTPRRNLSDELKIEHGVGSMDHVHFLLEHDIVQEIWIDDLRTFPHEVTYKGRSVDRGATVSQLSEIFGPCSEVEQVLGGTRLTCASGLQVGIGSAGPEETIQIRMRR